MTATIPAVQPAIATPATIAHQIRQANVPPELVLLYNARDGGQKSMRGPDPEWSYAATQYDNDGTAIGAIPAVHYDKDGNCLGVWFGPGYSNLWPAGGEDFVTSVDTSILTSTPISNSQLYKIDKSSTGNGGWARFSGLYTGAARLSWIVSAGSISVCSIRLHKPMGDTPYDHFAGFSLDGDGSVLNTTPEGYSTSIEHLGQGLYLCSLVKEDMGIGDAASYWQFGLGMSEADPVVQIGDYIYAMHPLAVQSRYQFPYVSPGITVASAAGSTGGNGMSFPLKTEKDERLLECFRGKPDGVELIDDTGWSLLQYTTRDGTVFTLDGSVDGHYAGFYKPVGAQIGDLFLVDYDVLKNTLDTPNQLWFSASGFTGVLTPTDDTVGNHRPIVEATEARDFKMVNGPDATSGEIIIRINSVQKLQPAKMTMAVLCTMGVGSDELVGYTTQQNIVSTADSQSKPLFYRGDETADGVAVQGRVDNAYCEQVRTSWQRGEQHLKLLQAAEDGSGYRVGHCRLGIDAPVWEEWAAWPAGHTAFETGDYIRLAFNGLLPLYIKQLQVWEGEVTIDKIERMLKYA